VSSREYLCTSEAKVVQFHNSVWRHFHPCIIAIVEQRSGGLPFPDCLFARHLGFLQRKNGQPENLTHILLTGMCTPSTSMHFPRCLVVMRISATMRKFLSSIWCARALPISGSNLKRLLFCEPPNSAYLICARLSSTRSGVK